jgi:PAS domain S-box-containing protein
MKVMEFKILKEIANHIPGVIFFAKSRDGRFIYACLEYEQLFQVNRKWLIGKTCHDLMPEDLADICHEHDQFVLSKEIPQKFDEHYLINGKQHTFSSIKIPLRDESGTVYGVAGISIDVTESKRNEEALTEANARLEALVNAIPDIVIFKDAECRHLLVNRAAEKIMGLSREEAAGKTNEAVLPPEAAAMCRASDEKALASLEPVHAEESVVTETGETIHLDTIKAPIHDEVGKLTGLVAVSRDITERKQHEEALRASQERFRMFADFTYDWEYWIGPEGDFIYTSPACEKVTGYGPEHFRDFRQLIELVHPEDRKLLAEHIKEYSQENIQSYELEFRIIDRRGEERWLAHACRPVYSRDGNYMGCRASNRDITERKNVEQQMKLFIDLVNQSNDGLMVIDLHSGHITLVNKKLCRELQYTREELLSMRPEDISTKPVGFFDRHFSELRKVGTWLEEDYHRRKDGTIFPVEVSVKYTRVDEREFAVAVIRDISERKRIEQELHESDRLLRDVLENLPVGVWILDKSGRIKNANREGEKIWAGVRHIGIEQFGEYKAWWLDTGKRIQPEEWAAARAVRKGEITNNEVIEIEAFDGSRKIITNSATPIRDERGEITAVVVAAQDITESKKAEKELQKAQKLESIGLLAGGIAHDFNNILTAIQGNIELARMLLPPGETAAARLAVAERASMRARGLSQQLLTFARGGAPIKEAIAVPHLVREAVGLALRGSNVRGEYFFSEDLRPVEVDEGQLNQAISNLAINAVEAMPEGGVVTVDAANESLSPETTLGLLPGEYVRIDIKDQGVGIPKDVQERIFDLYFTTKERGSGLGLAISFSIVKRHGGTITVDSLPGKGSTFSIFLPASQKRIPKGEEEHREIVAGTGRILVMDDEGIVRDVAAEMLQHLGYRVETVRDGAEAITAFRQAIAAGEPFDAVITDLTVPADMGGKETVRHLLEIDPKAKVIVSSGYNNDPVMANYTNYGFKGVIMKPFSLTDLSKTLEEVIGGKEQ